MPDFESLTKSLRRAEKLAGFRGWSPAVSQSEQHLYGRAADAIDALRDGTVVTYGVVLDTDGSTDVYNTIEEAVAAYRPGCRILRIETRDTDITDQMVPA